MCFSRAENFLAWREEEARKSSFKYWLHLHSTKNDSKNNTIYEIRKLKLRSDECENVLKEQDTKSAIVKSKHSKWQSIRRTRTNKESKRVKPMDVLIEQRWAIRDEISELLLFCPNSMLDKKNIPSVVLQSHTF